LIFDILNYFLQLDCNLVARMDFNDAVSLSWLEQILTGNVDGTMSATILANLQMPEIQAEAKALFGHSPTSIGELATNIGEFLLPPLATIPDSVMESISSF
jgi:hypothetical protein